VAGSPPPNSPPKAANDPLPAYQFGLAEIDGEPRVRDLDLAERLGFDRPRDIRKLIERNRSEIEGLGTCATVAHVVRGNPTKELHLNEEQALLVAVLSNAPQAAAVRAMLIRTFVSYRRGQIGGLDERGLELLQRTDGIARMLSHKVTEIEKALPALRAELLTALIESDPRVVATTFKPALDVLEERGVPARGRRGFSQRVSSRLRRYSVDRQIPMRASHETKRWLFHADAIAGWMALEGDAMIRDHIDKVNGQGRLHLVRAA
jgi:hypothetical protein